MSIIISKNGMNAKRLEKTNFKKEKDLQKYIFENPDCIPIDDIKENVQFIILDREFPVNAGSIDALGVDSEGDIYIIETKLYKNPDKRKVLAQVLDYGASLWNSFSDANEFIKILSLRIMNKRDKSLVAILEESFGESEEIIENMKYNLSNGFYRFIILMDKVPSILKNLILYINQYSQFSVYSVELEYYSHEGYEILIPDIFGAEVQKKSAITKNRKIWNKELFFQNTKQRVKESSYKAIIKIYEFSKEKANEITWGTGIETGSFNPKFYKINSRAIYTVRSDGKFIINRWPEDYEKTREWKNNLCDKLTKIKKISNYITKSMNKTYITIPPKAWTPVVDEIIKILDNML